MSAWSSRKKTLAAIFTVIVVVAVASTVALYQSRTSPQTQPKLSLDHVTIIGGNPLPTNTAVWPAMLASKLGFYEKNGLTVESVGTSGALEVLSALATGKVEFGGLSVSVMVPARANGTDIKYVFMLLQRDPVVVYTLEKSGIKTPKDLEGKTMGTSFASSEYATMPLFGKAAGFDYKKVKYINTSPAQYITLLLSGQIDATMAFFSNYHVFEDAAAKQGQKLVTFFRYNYVDWYGSGLAATDSFIKQHADVVKVMAQGYGYGLQYMVDNPKDASNLLTSMMRGADQEAVYTLARTYAEFKPMVAPRQADQPYGIMDDKTWNATINIMVDYLGSKRVAPKDMYTNEFIATQYVPKAHMVSPIISFCDNFHALPYERLDPPAVNSDN